MVRTSNPDHFCIVLPFFRPLGVPLYAFGAKKKASCTFLNSPSACRKYFSTSREALLRFFVWKREFTDTGGAGRTEPSFGKALSQRAPRWYAFLLRGASVKQQLFVGRGRLSDAGAPAGAGAPRACCLRPS